MVEITYFGLVQPLAAEFFAMFLHTFWGSMFTTPPVYTQSINETSLEINYLTTALVPALQAGLAVYMFIVLFWKVCIINFNPAISMGFVVSGVLHWKLFVPYVAMQCLGSTLGAWIAQSIKQDIPGPISVAEGANILSVIGHEIVVTGAMIFFAVATVVQEDYDQQTGPLAIGLTVFQGVIGGRWIGGSCLNVSRAFGPALVLNDWRLQWVWWVGDMLGAIIFASIYMIFFAPEDKLWIRRWVSKKQAVQVASSCDEETVNRESKL